MARPPRIQLEAAFYHTFNRGVEKRAIFFDERDYKTFLHLLKKTALEYRLRLFSFCLMKNHFHLFIQTLQANLGPAMQYLQGQYGQYVNRRHKRTGALFQSRYKSPLVDEETYAFALARYIHRNPLKAGLVTRLEDYPWSSYPCYTEKLPQWKWLDTAWLLKQFHDRPDVARQLFQQFHQMYPPRAETKTIDKMGLSLGEPRKIRPFLLTAQRVE